MSTLYTVSAKPFFNRAAYFFTLIVAILQPYTYVCRMESNQIHVMLKAYRIVLSIIEGSKTLDELYANEYFVKQFKNKYNSAIEEYQKIELKFMEQEVELKSRVFA